MELFRSSSLARFSIICVSPRYRRLPRCALAPFRQLACLFTHVTSQCAELGAHLRRRSSFLFGRLLRSRVLLSKKDHQERVTHEGLSNIYYDPLLGHNDRVCSDFLLSRQKWFLHVLARIHQMSVWTLFVSSRRTCLLRLILDARRSNQHVRVPPKFRLATGTAYSSRVELLIGNPDGGEALALHTSLLVTFRVHFITWVFPNELRPYFCLRPLSARAFGMTEKNVQGVRVSAEQNCFLRH